MKLKNLYLSFLLVCLVVSMLPMVKASAEVILSEYTDIDANDPEHYEIVNNHPYPDYVSASAGNFTTTAKWSVTAISFFLARYDANLSNYDSYVAARIYEPDPLNISNPDETQIVANSSGVRVDSLPEDEGYTVGAWINFTFETPISLTNSHNYFFATYSLNGTWDEGASLMVFVYGNHSDPVRGSNNFRNGWIFYSTFFSLGYIIYGEILTDPITWRDLSNSAIVTLATILLPIVYLTGTALYFIHDKQNMSIKEIVVIVVGFLLVAVLFPIGMNALLA